MALYRVIYHDSMIDDDHISHHGVKGMKWGVRRYQNLDGTLTEEGKRRYKSSVFISGSSKTQFEDSPYFRKELPKEVSKKIDEYISQKRRILVGEAPGIDRQVQDYLKKNGYGKVTVYTSNDEPRYLADNGWKVKRINAKGFEPGSPEFLRQKDIAMTRDADEGLSVILENGGAGATRNNILRLMEQDKKVQAYILNSDKPDAWVQNLLEELTKNRRN